MNREQDMFYNYSRSSHRLHVCLPPEILLPPGFVIWSVFHKILNSYVICMIKLFVNRDQIRLLNSKTMDLGSYHIE